MANNEYNDNAENHQIGRELYRKDQQHDRSSNSRHGYANDRNPRWSEGNFFHTGPSPRGAQDRDSESYNRGGSSNTSYNQGQNAHLNDHYGSRSGSAYRNERAYINHGDRGSNSRNSSNYEYDERHSMRRPHTPGGALERNPGNHRDHNESVGEPWREGPFTGSRYKEDDYRYGSGSHNWYKENRYTPDADDNRRYGNRQQHDDRGFMDKVKDTWNDIWHSDDRDYHSRNREASYNNTDNRRGYENYRNRSYDSGYENGPRWADRSDAGDDSHYRNADRNQRYRR